MSGTWRSRAGTVAGSVAALGAGLLLAPLAGLSGCGGSPGAGSPGGTGDTGGAGGGAAATPPATASPFALGTGNAVVLQKRYERLISTAVTVSGQVNGQLAVTASPGLASIPAGRRYKRLRTGGGLASALQNLVPCGNADPG